MATLILLCISCGIVSAVAEKKKYKILTISNAVLFIFLSVFMILGSRNQILVLACKNIIRNEARYNMINSAIRESMGITQGVFSVYFMIQMLAVGITVFVVTLMSIKALKGLKKEITKILNSLKKTIKVSTIRIESENVVKENENYNNYLYLSNEALLI